MSAEGPAILPAAGVAIWAFAANAAASPLYRINPADSRLDVPGI
jgi:hypothetical protein